MAKYTSFKDRINIKNISCSSIFSTRKIVMGILNITEDSFYDGGKYMNKKHILKQTKKMLEEGAKIIDIGAQSSRPGSHQISSKEELKKIIPTIKLLKKEFQDILISIDTFWAETARNSVLEGANIINDISAGAIDNTMFETIAELKVPYILMHMQGTPDNMQKNPRYEDVTKEVFNFFKQKIKLLNQKGISDIIIDPGFGFGKTINHNYELLNNLEQFQKLGCPILVGISRKSMIQEVLSVSAKEALNGTTITNTLALNNGANILRVHDVKEAIECIKIYKRLQPITK